MGGVAAAFARAGAACLCGMLCGAFYRDPLCFRQGLPGRQAPGVHGLRFRV